MKNALEILAKNLKTDKIIIKGKGELCYNAVTICNIITENILKGNSKIQNITVDSEILDDGRMISTIELVLIKTNYNSPHTKYNMLAIQEITFCTRNEELAAI